MSLPVRVTTLIVAFLAVVGGVIFVVAHYLLGGPPTVDFTASGGQVNVVMQTDASSSPSAVPSDPTWVSLLHQEPGHRELGPHHAVPSPRAHPGERDDPRL